MTHHYDVAIVGNGVLGLATAWALHHEDPTLHIAVIGPADRPGCASYAAGLMLNCFAELDVGALEHPVKRSKLELAIRSRTMWPQWLAEVGERASRPLSMGEGTTILYNAAGDDLDDATWSTIVAALAAYREPHEHVEPRDLVNYRPAMRARALRALHLPHEAYLPSGELLNTLSAALETLDGVELHGGSAQKITVDGDRTCTVDVNGVAFTAAKVVIAAGSASQTLIDQLPIKDAIPRLFYGIGAGAVLETDGLAPSQVIRSVNRGMACGIHAVPYDKDVVYVGASNLICPWPEPPRLTSIHAVLEAAMTQVHTGYYKARVREQRVGFRPTTLDTFPLIGATSLATVFLLTGTKREGVHFAPLWSRTVAREVLGRNPDCEHPFRPERSLIHTLSRSEGIDLAVAHARSGAYQHGLVLPTSGWDAMVEGALRGRVEEVYAKCGIADFGIPPEMLEMYRHGHAGDGSLWRAPGNEERHE